MENLIKLLRPDQWIKNGFCFLPLFFDKHLFDIKYLISGICIFFIYCFAASGIYCLNDIYDVESDKRHKKKCKRPIACGAISKATGYIVMSVCWIFAFALISISDFSNNKIIITGIIAFYIIMNIAYCIKLKQKAIIDVFIIAIGFVLRLLAGGFATDIWMSQWIILMTFLLALFLAFAKRRDDVVMFEATGMKTRKNINQYNIAFMNQAISIIASITIVCYIMYTVSPEVTGRIESKYLYTTSIYVLIGIIRYLQLTIVDLKSGSPTQVLLKDRFIQLCIAGWIVTFTVILYL